MLAVTCCTLGLLCYIYYWSVLYCYNRSIILNVISHLQLAEIFFRFGINSTCILEKFDVQPFLPGVVLLARKSSRQSEPRKLLRIPQGLQSSRLWPVEYWRQWPGKERWGQQWLREWGVLCSQSVLILDARETNYLMLILPRCMLIIMCVNVSCQSFCLHI